MEVVYINEIDDIKEYGEISIAHGFFDGVHIAHQQLIKKSVEYAKQHQISSGIVTFNKKFVDVNCNKESYIKQLKLSSIERRLELFKFFEVDYVFVINFETFRDLSASEYINTIITPLGTKHFVMGKDNCFGKEGLGCSANITSFMKKQFSVDVVDLLEDSGEKISSSRIKQLILDGKITEANNMLNYYYRLNGVVTKGKQIGRTIGFPTANLKVENHMLFPKIGVYATLVKVKGKIYKAMTNIGYNPTIDFRKCINIETYIFDFSEEIYQKELELYFICEVREEKKFDSLDKLIERLKQDEVRIRKVLEDIDNNFII